MPQREPLQVNHANMVAISWSMSVHNDWRDFFDCSCRNFQVVLSYPANSCYARLTDVIAKTINQWTISSIMHCYISGFTSLFTIHHILNLNLSKICFCSISQKLHLHAWQCLFSSLQVYQTIEWLDTYPMIYLQLLSQWMTYNSFRILYLMTSLSSSIYSERTYQRCRSGMAVLAPLLPR